MLVSFLDMTAKTPASPTSSPHLSSTLKLLRDGTEVHPRIDVLNFAGDCKLFTLDERFIETHFYSTQR